jgi:hypothetical protein
MTRLLPFKIFAFIYSLITIPTYFVGGVILSYVAYSQFVDEQVATQILDLALDGLSKSENGSLITNILIAGFFVYYISFIGTMFSSRVKCRDCQHVYYQHRDILGTKEFPHCKHKKKKVPCACEKFRV